MLIKTDRWLRGEDIPASEITPQHIFEQRRRFLAAATAAAVRREERAKRETLRAETARSLASSGQRRHARYCGKERVYIY